MKIGDKKGRVNKSHHYGYGYIKRFFLQMIYYGNKNSGDGHGAADRETIGDGQALGCLKNHQHEKHGDHKKPVDGRDIYLRFQL